MKTTVKLVALPLALLAIYFAEHFKASGGITFHGAMPGAVDSTPVPTVHLVIDAFTLFLGVVLGNMSARLHAHRAKGVEKIALRKELVAMLQSTDFWIALCAAPVVFAVLVGMMGSMTLLASAVFSLQNGFFWQSVMPSKPVPHVAVDALAPAPPKSP